MAITVEGSIAKVFFKDYEKGIAGFKLDSIKVTKGVLPHGYALGDLEKLFFTAKVNDAHKGVKVQLDGSIEIQNGRDKFKTKSCCEFLPSTVDDIKAYLEDGAIPYFKQDFASQLIDAFGPEAIKEYYEAPLYVADVLAGRYSKNHILHAHRAWVMSRSNAMEHPIFTTLDLTYQERGVICKDLKSRTAESIIKNPFLAVYYADVNFRKVDERISQNKEQLGLSEQGFQAGRRRAALYHVFNDFQSDGHTALPVKLLILQSAKLLREDDLAGISAGIQEMVKSGGLHVFQSRGKTFAQTPYWHRIESEFTQKIQFLLDVSPDVSSIGARVIDESEYGLHEAQYRAVQTALNNQFSVITGGPGTGKTTTVKSIYSSLNEVYRQKSGRELKIVAAAPSALAAERLTEATGVKAVTCHSALGIVPGEELSFNCKQIDADLVVVDEATLIDQVLFLAIMRSIRPGSRVIIMGDVDQLPSISCGRVFGDIVEGGVIPTTRLTKTFRFKEGARFTDIIGSVRDGVIVDPVGSDDDWEFVPRSSSKDTAEAVVETFKSLLDEGASREDIQIIVPIHGDYNGTLNLNRLIQDHFSPMGELPHVSVNGYRIQLHDRVMSVESAGGISNGRDGVCCHVSSNFVTVDFGGKKINYYPETLHKIQPAWVKTIHKMQGSEAKYVIVPMAIDNKKHYTWQSLFTALTRMKTKAFCIGDADVFKSAVNSGRGEIRCTGLITSMRNNISPAPVELRKALQTEVSIGR